MNYAQARYFDQGQGRFVSEDNIKGTVYMPKTTNTYSYVWNNPLALVDLDGNWPTISDIGKGIGNSLDKAGKALNDAGQAAKDFWNDHVYGTSDTIIYDYGGGLKDTTVSTKGGKIFVRNTVTTLNPDGTPKSVKVGGSMNIPIDVKIPTPWGTVGLSDKTSVSFDNSGWSSLKVKNNRDASFTNNDGFKTGFGYGLELSSNPSLSFTQNGKQSDGSLFGSTYSLNTEGWTINQILSGLSKGNITNKLTQEVVIKNWTELLELAKVPVMIGGVIVLSVLALILVADDVTGIGILDDPLLVPVFAGISSLLGNLSQVFGSNPAFASACLN